MLRNDINCGFWPIEALLYLGFGFICALFFTWFFISAVFILWLFEPVLQPLVLSRLHATFFGTFPTFPRKRCRRTGSANTPHFSRFRNLRLSELQEAQFAQLEFWDSAWFYFWVLLSKKLSTRSGAQRWRLSSLCGLSQNKSKWFYGNRRSHAGRTPTLLRKASWRAQNLRSHSLRKSRFYFRDAEVGFNRGGDFSNSEAYQNVQSSTAEKGTSSHTSSTLDEFSPALSLSFRSSDKLNLVSRATQSQFIDMAGAGSSSDGTSPLNTPPADTPLVTTSLRSLHAMPRPGQPGALYFDGDNITEFLEDWDSECDEYNYPVEWKCARLPNYCEKEIKTAVKFLPGYIARNWVMFQDDLKALY